MMPRLFYTNSFSQIKYKKTLKDFRSPRVTGGITKSSKRSQILYVNNTHREKLCYLIQYNNGWLAASGLFDTFIQSIK